ncbi:MAG: sugar ABC transporter permease [Chloroflexi bacterium]|nr:MAG: sugar ABC transporter permease [Chloroflexota bacterium]
MHRKTRAGLFFLLPGVVWILAFTLFPLIFSLGLSFTNRRLGRETRFIGLENYGNILNDIRVADTIFTSAFFAVGGLLLTLILGTFIAWLFNHDIPGLRVFRSILTMPMFAAPIAVGFLGITLFNEQNGPVNNIIAALGFERVGWFIEPTAARIAVLIIDTWQWTPFVFIVVLAAMQGIPDELYEAARLDTASEWMLFWRITLPLILPSMGTVALLRLVETFKILDIPLAMLGGGPGSATTTYSYYAFLNGTAQRGFRMGYASALAYLLVVVAIIISSIYFWRMRHRFEID